MNKTETTKIYSLFAAVVPNARDMDKTAVSLLLEVWQAVFADLSFATAQTAAMSLLRTRTISVLPQPGEIVQAAVDSYMNAQPTALEGWQQAVAELKQSRVAGLWLSNPIAAATVEAIGADRMWWETCSSFAENPDAMRREWEREYGNQIKRERAVLTERGELEKRLAARIPRRQLPSAKAPVKAATFVALPAMTKEEKERSYQALLACRRQMEERTF